MGLFNRETEKNIAETGSKYLNALTDKVNDLVSDRVPVETVEPEKPKQENRYSFLNKKDNPVVEVKTPIVEVKNPIVSPQEAAIEDSRYGEVDVFSLKGIHQEYVDHKGKGNVIFDDFDFAVKDVKGQGQFVVIIGASGCGKSTILRYIAGLQKPTKGEIFINGKPQTDKDRIGMVFQQYSSFEWYTVLDNIMLPLKMQGVGKKEAKERAMEMIKLLKLDGHEHKYAKYPNLSGGQLQRVAIARNLIANGSMLLMDEPFGALDIQTRYMMQDMLADVWTKMKGDPTILLVTHDIPEAVYLADEIYIMDSNPGRVIRKVQVDLPLERDAMTKRSPEFLKYVYEIEDIMMSIEGKS